MNFGNGKISKPHVVILKLTDKSDLGRGEKNIALSNLSIYHAWKNIKRSYHINKFKISAPTRNDKLELWDGLYSISDILDYFEHILKKHNESIDNNLIRIYVNKIENGITFKIKKGYHLEILKP